MASEVKAKSVCISNLSPVPSQQALNRTCRLQTISRSDQESFYILATDKRIKTHRSTALSIPCIEGKLRFDPNSKSFDMMASGQLVEHMLHYSATGRLPQGLQPLLKKQLVELAQFTCYTLFEAELKVYPLAQKVRRLERKHLLHRSEPWFKNCSIKKLHDTHLNYRTLAATMNQAGGFKQGQRYAQQADRFQAEIFWRLGQIELQQQNHPKALDMFQRAIAANNTVFRYYESLIEIGQTIPSFRPDLSNYLQQSLILQPRSKDFQLLCQLTLAEKNYTRAAYYVTQWLIYDPNNPTALLYRATCHIKAQQWSLAYTCIAQANPKHPSQAHWAYQAARCLCINNFLSQAYPWLQQAVHFAPKHMEYRQKLIQLGQHLGYRNETLRLIKQNLRQDPKNLTTLCQATKFYLACHDIDNAINYLQIILLHKSDCIQAHLHTALCYRSIQQFPSALKHANVVFAAMDAHHSDLSLTQVRTLTKLFGQIQPEGAQVITCLRHLINDEPLNPEPYRQMARHLALQGQLVRAGLYARNAQLLSMRSNKAQALQAARLAPDEHLA